MLRGAKAGPLTMALLVVLGGTTAALWLAFGRDARSIVAPGSGTSAASEALVTPTSVEPLSAAEPVHPSSAADATAVRSEATTESDDAPEIEGRVLFPPGTPADEEAFVVARAGSSSQRARVGPDGAFRISFPRDKRKARLDLEARYLYLERSVSVDPRKREDSVTLEPSLGGCLEVTLVPPSRDEDVVREIRSSEIGLFTTTIEPSPPARLPKGTIGADLVARFGGLTPHHTYGVRIHPQTLVKAGFADVRIEAGTIERVELRLEQGVGVRGRVIDEQGVGIAEARVEGWTAGEVDGTGVLLDEAGVLPWRTTRITQTSADGSFELTGLAPGTLHLEATKDFFADAELGPRELAVGHDLVDLSIVLSRGGVIAGFVRWPDGSPAEALLRTTPEEVFESGEEGASFSRRGLEEAQMRTKLEEILESGEGSQSFPRKAPDFLLRTDETGRFDLGGLQPGLYAIEADAAWSTSSEKGRPAGVEGRWQARCSGIATGTRDLVLVLEPSLGLSGRVLDDTGVPLEQFRITAVPVALPESVLDCNLIMDGVEDGRFRLDGLHTGQWRVSAEAGDVSSAETLVTVPVDTAELVLVVPRAAQVNGRVVDPRGAGVPKANVSTRLANVRRFYFAENEAPGRTRANSEGVFQLKRIPPGPVQIVADAPGLGESEALALDLLPGEVREGIVLALRAGATLEIELASSVTPRAERSVQVMGESGGDTYRTDATGHIVVEGLDPGRYLIELIAEPGERGRLPWAEAEVQLGERTRVVLGVSAENAIRVSGRVSSAGIPLEDVNVHFMGVGGLISGKTDGAGRYEVAVGLPGEYEVMIGGRFGPWRTTVVVSASREVFCDFDLPSGSVAGRLLSQDGAPRERVRVTLARVDADRDVVPLMDLVQVESSDRDGTFSFPHVYPGRYVVIAGDLGPMRSRGSQYSAMAISAEIEVDGKHPVEDIELRLHQTGSVLAVVHDVDSRPVPGARIEIVTPGGSFLKLGWWGFEPTTNAGGSVVVEAPGTGTVRLVARLGERRSAVVEASVLAGRTSEATLVLED